MATYTVKPGDTMWRIAIKHGISLDELIAANPQITNPSFIVPGQTINIPDTGTQTYTVRPGDTMWDIATKHGVKLDDLIAVNPQITNPSLILPGQTINIPTEIEAPSVPTDISAMEAEVIRLVNAERTKAGRAPLTENKELSRIARLKSQDFVNNNYLSHYSPTYGSPFDMMRSFGIKFTSAGENIAKGQRSPAEVMNFWMNSSGHRANILNANFNQIGVGVARDNRGTLYWTQMFIGG